MPTEPTDPEPTSRPLPFYWPQQAQQQPDPQQQPTEPPPEPDYEAD